MNTDTRTETDRDDDDRRELLWRRAANGELNWDEARELSDLGA